ncbi:Hint domain-containing protein [Pseudoruegeria sp. SHC-113]|uniref:Hint domain-containing protein n=1 Tax=Pseudoruegeria sp. SHC-113 TaxID=2855439 RepID=UPI0021BA9638|nr:Hint domain-containing protein [Pseudoruegeria sp. SHC-113]MCT8160730.1 Hint domain-containing protein [Pseudoruegeria sp. SHC-113]
MPEFIVYTLPESQITISGGQQLSGISQGSGVHLAGQTITLNSNAWEPVTITDTDDFFGDSDSSQTLTNAITYDGTAYDAGRRVEAEYTLTVEDPDGNQYTLIGFNINEPGVTSYATVEGLAFIGGEGEFPPIGVPLTVVSTAEGPGGTTTGYDTYATPPCFLPGTRIETDRGCLPVEALRPGDRVMTQDNGFQPLVWVGQARITRRAAARKEALRPILIAAGALGGGLPERDLMVSPQHRMLFEDWRAELATGEERLLVAALHLVGQPGISAVLPAGDVTYHHIMCAEHQIICAEGCWTESFRPGLEVLDTFEAAVRDELLSLFPQLAQGQGSAPAARLATHYEAAVMLAG